MFIYQVINIIGPLSRVDNFIKITLFSQYCLLISGYSLREFCRILKSGGILIINSCSPEQIESGFWFYHLIPDAVQEMKQKVISLSELKNLLEDCGFTIKRQVVTKDLVLQRDAYFNEDGIFDPDWRNGDSIWSLVSEYILATVLNKVRYLRETGKLEAYIKQQDQKKME